jgi:hypothetical protein
MVLVTGTGTGKKNSRREHLATRGTLRAEREQRREGVGGGGMKKESGGGGGGRRP